VTEPEPRDVPLADIDEPDAVIRSKMDPDKLDGLVSSIRDVGQIQRIVVYPDADRLKIAAGHRRYVALSILGDRPARCDVYGDKFDAMLAVQIAENIFREDMAPTDEAIFFARLLEHYTEDTTRLAARLKLNRDYIEGRLALLAGDAEIFAALAVEKISIGVAHALNGCADEKTRRMFLDMAMHREATVRTVEGWIAETTAMRVLTERAAADAGVERPAPSGDEPAPSMCCDVCGDADEPWTMVMVWMHTRCKKMRDRLVEQALSDRMVSRG